MPALVALGLVVWQLILVGQAAWMSAHAARAAARAQLVGEDPEAAARSALPRGLEAGLEVRSERTGATRVEVPVPIVHPGWRGSVRVAARAGLEPAR